jgi:hypothetical protein
LELQNIETKNFKSSQQERRIPSPPPLWNFTILFWRPIKWQEENWQLWNFKIVKKNTFNCEDLIE